ncbi:PREDICTED: uncharacterized protein LOC100637743 [Amphimedon queenslandica]|uniref:FZ domain-containing protein n=1 Tax=Amphimedon queenslandica TaxID=400682 RepID=A0A1X7VL43_AMPQE|nr:PREDICTED: uncharacterized protein LOC100637743 [Amphimedon queenslandica]|eukprot:XP_003383679.1 PREDICTED: uncharacterized protein LOC100637743 [Amphimedon queenslandica]
MYLLLALLFLFLVQNDCQELFLTIREEENGQELSESNNISSRIAEMYQTTTYSNSSSRCICQAVQGENSLLEYTSNIESCISDPYNSSALGVCSSLFFKNATYSTMYRIEVKDASSDNSSRRTMTVTQFCDKMESVRESLAKFETLLAQTLVCVYLNTCDDKNFCLISYINWLCMTQLDLYRNSSTSNRSSRESADFGIESDGTQYNPVKPCYGVCTNVLRDCPYYLPSSYQHATINNEGEYSYVTMEYVYGGYPAFACPGSSSVSDEKSNSSYGTESNCILVGESGAPSNRMSFLMMLVTLTLLNILM